MRKSLKVIGLLVAGPILLALFQRGGKEQPALSQTRLPGRQLQCIGGKLDPICVGYRFSMATGKYGGWVSHKEFDEDVRYGYKSGIAGWYIGGLACRFYYVAEENSQCLDRKACPIIKEIACE